jgi:hypothetical protein
MFFNTHLIGPGIGGQAAHCPPSKVASQLRKKNAKAVVLSVVLAAALASFSHSFSMSILSPNLLRDSKVGISADKCVRRRGAKESMIEQRRVPENVEGSFLDSIR